MVIIVAVIRRDDFYAEKKFKNYADGFPCKHAGVCYFCINVYEKIKLAKRKLIEYLYNIQN